MGYPVNVAARLQAQTKKFNNSLIVSDEIFENIREKPENAISTTTDLKGVTGEVKIHLLGKPFQSLAKE